MIFYFVGRLVSEKGVLNLLQALALASLKENKKLTLIIIGDGNWRQKLEEEAVKLKIVEQVNFVGKKTGLELQNFIEKAEIAIVPSEWEEPMGIVALELLAAGKNIIVSQNGGLAECIGKAGLLFPNGNSEKLSEAMLQLKNDEQLKIQHKREAIEQLKKFKPEELAEQYLTLFDEILNKKN